MQPSPLEQAANAHMISINRCVVYCLLFCVLRVSRPNVLPFHPAVISNAPISGSHYGKVVMISPQSQILHRGSAW